MVKVGKPAPTFTLQGYYDDKFQEYSLSDYKGKWVVFFFYPLDFTFICPTEVTGFSKHIQDFKDLNTVVLGCSVDSVHSHKAWEKELGKFEYPLLSDIRKEVGRMYNVLDEDEGTNLRATFVIDPEGIVQYHLVNSNDIGRNIGEIIRVVSALQSGELCPVDWTPGEKTLGKA